MNKYLIALAFVAVAVAEGPTRPYGDMQDRDCAEEGEMVVDDENMCWYWMCVYGQDSGEEVRMTMLPRRCALGSKIPYNFISTKANPCQHNFDDVDGYECERTEPSTDSEPSCYASLDCFNGGTRRWEVERCWCDCPNTWQGNYDCSLPTQELSGVEGSNICVDGEPLEDWCSMEGNGCLNGGTCYNQCDTFWCDCSDVEDNDHYGKRCELL